MFKFVINAVSSDTFELVVELENKRVSFSGNYVNAGGEIILLKLTKIMYNLHILP